MKKFEKSYKVKNLRTGEMFFTSSSYEKIIDGDFFIGVWKETTAQPRVLWMRKDSLVKVK